MEMELKDRIAQARKAAGLSQEQLGEKLGVSGQAVSEWESGAVSPDAAALAAMCRELGVSADWLLLGEEPDGTPLTGEDRPDGYTLLLTAPGENPHLTYDAVSNLSWKKWARRGAPWTGSISNEEAADIVDRVPVILCRGLTKAQVWEAMGLFQSAKVYPLIYQDTNGDTAEELRRVVPFPREDFRPPEEKRGMTFGMTVLAVVVGLIAYGLLLSVLSAVF